MTSSSNTLPVDSLINPNYDPELAEKCKLYSVSDIDLSVIKLDIMSVKSIDELNKLLDTGHTENPEANQIVIYLGDPDKFVITKNDLQRFIEMRTEKWITSIRVEHAFFEWMIPVILGMQDNIKDIRFHHNDQDLEDEDVAKLVATLLQKSKNRTLYLSPLGTDDELLKRLQKDASLNKKWIVTAMPENKGYVIQDKKAETATPKKNKQQTRKRQAAVVKKLSPPTVPVAVLTKPPVKSVEMKSVSRVELQKDDVETYTVVSPKDAPKIDMPVSSKKQKIQDTREPVVMVDQSKQTDKDPVQGLLRFEIARLRRELAAARTTPVVAPIASPSPTVVAQVTPQQISRRVIPEPFTISPATPVNGATPSVQIFPSQRPVTPSIFSAFALFRSPTTAFAKLPAEQKSSNTHKL